MNLISNVTEDYISIDKNELYYLLKFLFIFGFKEIINYNKKLICAYIFKV